MIIDLGLNDNIEVGDLLYSHTRKTHCIIYKMINTGTQKYDYILIDVENSMSEVDGANNIEAMVHPNDLELVCKNKNIVLKRSQ